MEDTLMMGVFIKMGWITIGKKRVPVRVYQDLDDTRRLYCLPTNSDSRYRIRREDITFAKKL